MPLVHVTEMPGQHQAWLATMLRSSRLCLSPLSSSPCVTLLLDRFFQTQWLLAAVASFVQLYNNISWKFWLKFQHQISSVSVGPLVHAQTNHHSCKDGHLDRSGLSWVFPCWDWERWRQTQHNDMEGDENGGGVPPKNTESLDELNG